MIPKAKIRGFEVCKGFEDRGVQLPTQATSGSAGYDFYCVEDTYIPIFNPSLPKPTFVPTGVKAYMKSGEALLLFARSSLSKQGLQLANSVGLTDQDYFGNKDNDGHIQFILWNYSSVPVIIKKGDRIGQGMFTPYLKADEGNSTEERTGGFGSTNKKEG